MKCALESPRIWHCHLPYELRPPGTQNSKGDQFKPQLINLRDDPGETTDVSAQHPDIAKRLAEKLRQQREQGYSRP